MAHPRSCSKHACIHVLLASFIMLAVAVSAEAPLPGVHRFDDLTDARGATTTSAAPISNGGGASPAMTQSVSLHYSLGAHKYLMEVFVQHRKFRAVAETGSSLTWLRTPRQQMSSNTLGCDSGLCTGSSCKCEGKQCSYDIHYGGGSTCGGSMFTEKLSFHSENAHNKELEERDMAIGWSEDADTYDRVVGLGRGEESLVKQLGHHTLSYCLATHTDDDDDKAGGDQKSKLIVGGAHSADAALQALLKESACEGDDHGRCKVHTTSLLLPDGEFYFVHLKSIKMGGATTIELPKVNAGKSSESTANMFIGSGVPHTILEKSAYEKVVEHVGNAMPKKAVKVPRGNTVCWTTDGEPDPEKLGALELELHFAGGLDEEGHKQKDDAILYLKKDQILYDDGRDAKGRRSVCLAFTKLDPEKKTSLR